MVHQQRLHQVIFDGLLSMNFEQLVRVALAASRRLPTGPALNLVLHSEYCPWTSV